LEREGEGGEKEQTKHIDKTDKTAPQLLRDIDLSAISPYLNPSPRDQISLSLSLSFFGSTSISSQPPRLAI
jgi:hypothetical protein